MSELTTYKLEDLGFLGRGKSRHRPRNDDSLFGGKYPFIQTGEVKAAEFYINTFEATYNEKGLEQSKLWDPGTLLITIAANIAETAILDIKACFPDSILGFIPDKDKADVRYIKYYIDTIKLRMQSISKGTTQDNLSLEKLRSINFKVPKVETQQKIASILSAFDDLIENNIRRIAILEEMARLIYREWFVHYRYPGHEKDELVDSGTELGEVPEGWGVKSFSDIADFQNGKAFKPKHWQDEGLPIVKIRELKNGFTDNTAYYHGDDIDEKYYIDDGDLLFAWSASLGIFLWYKGQALLNQHIFNVSQKVSYLTKDYLYYALDVSLKEFLTKTAGTTMQHIRKSALDEVHIALPPEAVYKHFDNSISPINSQILTLHKNVQRLKETRDLLLPMLISGKVNVNK